MLKSGLKEEMGKFVERRLGRREGQEGRDKDVREGADTNERNEV